MTAEKMGCIIAATQTAVEPLTQSATDPLNPDRLTPEMLAALYPILSSAPRLRAQDTKIG